MPSTVDRCIAHCAQCTRRSTVQQVWRMLWPFKVLCIQWYRSINAIFMHVSSFAWTFRVCVFLSFVRSSRRYEWQRNGMATISTNGVRSNEIVYKFLNRKQIPKMSRSKRLLGVDSLSELWHKFASSFFLYFNYFHLRRCNGNYMRVAQRNQSIWKISSFVWTSAKYQ